jgi:hypothetical protein
MNNNTLTNIKTVLSNPDVTYKVYKRKMLRVTNICHKSLGKGAKDYKAPLMINGKPAKKALQKAKQFTKKQWIKFMASKSI